MTGSELRSALIIVDIQNDFLPGGALPVPLGDQVVPVINRLQDRFDLIVATKDWHPAGHGSFVSSHPGHQPGDIVKLHGIDQILWPDHCVQNTPGAEFSSELDTQKIQKIFFKGTDPEIDSYSTFFDNQHLKSTGLSDYLRDHEVTDTYIVGLATDYCVKFSVLDATQEGFNTYVIKDACRGMGQHPGDVETAFEEMKASGAHILSSF